MIGSNNTISTKRTTEENGKDVVPSSYNLTDVACYIERAGAEIAMTYGDIPAYKQFLCVCEEVVDIVVGDLVFDEQGRTYKVYGDQTFDNNDDIENHTEVLIEIGFDKV